MYVYLVVPIILLIIISIITLLLISIITILTMIIGTRPASVLGGALICYNIIQHDIITLIYYSITPTM